jgi:uncharacterized membrane protein YsdA (DUF1294 family)
MSFIQKYLIIINVVTFIIYAIDKYKAINKKRRISELTLYTLGFLGGFFGAILAMILFRHKTKKFRFWFLNILYMIIWILFMWRFLWK